MSSTSHVGVVVRWSCGLNAINDVTDGVIDHVVIVITSELVNDVLVTSLITLA